jgi:hypothetical protein
VLGLEFANERQEGSWLDRMLSRKDLGDASLRDAKRVSQVLLSMTAHRLREVP